MRLNSVLDDWANWNHRQEHYLIQPPPNVTTDNLIQNAFHAVLTKNWNDQFRSELMKTMGAQAKYIRLLERRIGK